MSGISRFTPEEKAEIVLLALRNPDKVSEICRERGLSPVTYNKWKKRYISGGVNAMARHGMNEAEDWRSNNQKLKEVIGHLYVELITLKKKVEMER